MRYSSRLRGKNCLTRKRKRDRVMMYSLRSEAEHQHTRLDTIGGPGLCLNLLRWSSFAIADLDRLARSGLFLRQQRGTGRDFDVQDRRRSRGDFVAGSRWRRGPGAHRRSVCWRSRQYWHFLKVFIFLFLWKIVCVVTWWLKLPFIKQVHLVIWSDIFAVVSLVTARSRRVNKC